MGGAVFRASKLRCSHRSAGRLSRQRVELRPRAQLLDRLADREGADQVLLVPAGEDHQLARGVVHAGPHDGGVPLPAVGADERRIGFKRVFIQKIIKIVAN